MKKTRIYKKVTDTPSPASHLHDFLAYKKIKKLSIILLSTFTSSFFLVILFFTFIKTHQEFAANFADNTLRPMIGDTATITIESFFFNIEDHINQIKYETAAHPALPPTTSKYTIAATIGIANAPKFSLEPIEPLLADNALANEGQWTPLISSDEAVLIAKTQYRPDITHPYAVVTLVKMNMEYLTLGIVAGTQQPGGRYMPGPGIIPESVQLSNKLIAAFNGGFQQKDGYYGMIVGNTTYLPLEKDIATLILYQDGSLVLTRYTGQTLGLGIIAIRQNGPLLIENSQIVTDSSAWNMQTWGLTTTNSMYTWRSGIGLDKEGNLIYVVGSSLVPESLAKALLAAGAVNAMQLDINQYWVRYVLFNSIGSGRYSSYPIDTALVNGGSQYLSGYQKDFFYVAKK